MTKVIRVSVSYGLTINLGDYNNVKPEITIEAQLEKNDDEHEVITDLFAQAKNEIAAMLQSQCMASLGGLNLTNCNDYGDVEKLCLRQSTLYRYIHNLDRKRAVEAMAYPLWKQEEERRARIAAQLQPSRAAVPTVIKPGVRPGVHLASGFSNHDPIADIDDNQYADDRGDDAAAMTQD